MMANLSKMSKIIFMEFNMFKRIISILLIITLSLLCFVGCNDKQANTQTKGNGSTMESMDFEQRKDFVLQYVKDTYQLTGTIHDDVHLMTYYYSDDNDTYYARVDTSNFNKLCCWIEEDGTVVDSSFTWDMQDNIRKMFDPILSEYFTEFKTYPVLTFQECTKQWKPGEEQEMIDIESSLTIEIFLFLNHNDLDKFFEIRERNFDDKFNFADGTLNVQFVEDVNKVDVTGMDLLSYDYGYGFGKTNPNRNLFD